MPAEFVTGSVAIPADACAKLGIDIVIANVIPAIAVRQGGSIQAWRLMICSSRENRSTSERSASDNTHVTRRPGEGTPLQALRSTAHGPPGLPGAVWQRW